MRLIKFSYISVFRRHLVFTKIFTFTYFFVWFKFVFSSKKKEGKSNSKNHHHVLTLFLLIKQIIFYCTIMPSFLVWNLKELFFRNLSYVLKGIQDIYQFFHDFSYKLRTVANYFSQIFSSHFYLIDILFLPSYIYL